MKIFASVILSLLIATQLLAMENYFWLTDYEHSPLLPGEILFFWGQDTVRGPMRSNDWITTRNIRGLPTFYVQPITSMPGFGHTSPNPAAHFRGGPPIFNAPVIEFPDSLLWLREAAKNQNNFLGVPEYNWYGSVRGDSIWMFYSDLGEPIDTTDAAIVIGLRNFSKVLFVNGPLSIRGVLDASDCQLHVGCSRDIRLVDNLIIDGTNLASGELPAEATSRIAIASEQSILVGNTWENGRENSAIDSDIVVTALLFALRGSFTFEQQNDIGDPYISPTDSDERGYVILTGGITQRYRGPTHRANNGGTGYSKRYNYDERLRHWRTGVFEPLNDNEDEFTPVSDPLFPAQLTLAVSPNPFNANTTIRFTLPQASNVRAVVYDVLGREAAKLADASFNAGSHQLSWNAVEQATGVYFLRLETLGQIETRKLMLIK